MVMSSYECIETLISFEICIEIRNANEIVIVTLDFLPVTMLTH